MFTRRVLLQGSASLAATALIGRRADAIGGDPIRDVQARIDDVSQRAFSESGARSAIVVGLVTPDAPDGRLLFAGQDTSVNPFGDRLALDARTPF
jgi:hypothetical protein